MQSTITRITKRVKKTVFSFTVSRELLLDPDGEADGDILDPDGGLKAVLLRP